VNIKCPVCHGSNVILKHRGRRVGGAAGAVSGGIGGWLSATTGARVGAVLGSSLGPVGAGVGGLAGAILGGLLGAATGGLVGSEVGSLVDQRILKNAECLDCGTSFDEASPASAMSPSLALALQSHSSLYPEDRHGTSR